MALVAGGADLRRDVEVDRDVVIHRGLVLVVALRAAELAHHRAQLGEALDGAGAARADEQPVHLEQALGRGVQQQVGGLGCVETTLGCQRKRVDAEHGRVVALADQDSRRDTTRGLQGRAASRRANRSSSARSSITVAIDLPLSARRFRPCCPCYDGRRRGANRSTPRPLLVELTPQVSHWGGERWRDRRQVAGSARWPDGIRKRRSGDK